MDGSIYNCFLLGEQLKLLICLTSCCSFEIVIDSQMFWVFWVQLQFLPLITDVTVHKVLFAIHLLWPLWCLWFTSLLWTRKILSGHFIIIMLLTVITCSLLPYKIAETFLGLHHSSASSFIPSCSLTLLLLCFLWEVLIPNKYFAPSTLSQCLLQKRHQQHFRFSETWEISRIESRLFPSLWVTVFGKSTVLYQDSWGDLLD